MPAAALPIGAALLGPELGAAGATALGLGGATGLSSLIAPALGGALTGGLGSYIMGQDPMKGALMGGIGGGLSGGLGDLLGGGSSAVGDGTSSLTESGGNAAGLAGAASSEGISPALAAADPALAATNPIIGATASGATNAATAAAANNGSLLGSLGKGFSDMSPLTKGALTGLGSLALNKYTAVPVNNVQSKLTNDYKPPQPMNRQYTPVDPNSYLTASANRNYFNNVNPAVQYAKGGRVKCMADGGTPDMSVGMPINGAGDGLSDSIPAKLSDGEFVVSSPVVSALGNGSNKAGAKKLAMMQKNVHKRHFTGGKPKKALGLSSYMGA